MLNAAIRRLVVLAALTGAPGLVASTDVPTLEEILARHLERRGGHAALAAVETARMTGTLTSGGVSNPITIEYKSPDKIRVEVQTQGTTAVQAYDGESGWAVFPQRGALTPTELTGERLRQLRDRADVIEGPLVDFADKGHEVELLGQEEVDGRSAYKLRVRRQSGSELTTYLDAESLLEIKQVTQSKVGDTSLRVTVFIEDYRPVGEILRPHKTRAISEGGFLDQELVIAETELNVDIDDARFLPPRSETPLLGEDEYYEEIDD